jgi:hypothetical protein
MRWETRERDVMPSFTVGGRSGELRRARSSLPSGWPDTAAPSFVKWVQAAARWSRASEWRCTRRSR